MSKKLRFAVLVEGHLLKKWQVDAIQDLIDSDLASCVQIIENKGEESYQSVKLSIGYRFIERSTRNSGPLQVVDITTRFSDVPRMGIKAEKKGYANYFPSDAIAELQSLELDFILRFGFGIIKGALLRLPKYGVWSFHHGDPKQYRGGPAGFWEIYEKNVITGAMLQRIGEKLDQGELLKEGFYQSIQHSYKANLHHVLEASKNWATAVVRQILLQGELHSRPIQSKAKIYKTPNNIQSLVFLARIFNNKLRFHWESLFKAEKWNIGVVNQPISQVVDQELAAVEWLAPAPKHSYYADPFALSEHQIVAEVFSYQSQKGSIQQFDLQSKAAATPLLTKRTHLSYPNVIQDEGKTYILPENYRNRMLSLYEVENGQIVHETGILQGEWIDPTLFYYNKKWWLFCTASHSPKEQLYLFHADSITGPYEAHGLNPVLTDIKSARPAGTPFEKDGQWFRPTQNCSKTYGGSIVIKKIEQLSPTAYQESFVKELFPKAKGQYNQGLHTLSTFGDKILIDGKRYVFDFYHFKTQLLTKLKRKTL